MASSALSSFASCYYNSEMIKERDERDERESFYSIQLQEEGGGGVCPDCFISE